MFEEAAPAVPLAYGGPSAIDSVKDIVFGSVCISHNGLGRNC